MYCNLVHACTCCNSCECVIWLYSSGNVPEAELHFQIAEFSAAGTAVSHQQLSDHNSWCPQKAVVRLIPACYPPTCLPKSLYARLPACFQEISLPVPSRQHLLQHLRCGAVP